MQYPLGNVGLPTIKAMALKNKVAPKPKLVSTGKMPEQDLQYFRNKIVNAAARKRAGAGTATGGNTQTAAYGKAMNSAFKNTKTFGVPGAK